MLQLSGYLDFPPVTHCFHCGTLALAVWSITHYGFPASSRLESCLPRSLPAFSWTNMFTFLRVDEWRKLLALQFLPLVVGQLLVVCIPKLSHKIESQMEIKFNLHTDKHDLLSLKTHYSFLASTEPLSYPHKTITFFLFLSIQMQIPLNNQPFPSTKIPRTFLYTDSASPFKEC